MTVPKKITKAELLERAKHFLFDRQKAYQDVFKPESLTAKTVLEDLAKFCRAEETCVIPGSEQGTYIAEGRREVWLRIQKHLKLDSQDLADYYLRKDS